MASKKTISVVTNVKEFKSVLGSISSSADSLAQSIHIAGLFALSCANLHADVTNANQLLEAMGKKHDKKRVQQWLAHFGKITFDKSGVAVLRKRKDIQPENVEAWSARADATPYWELNKQEQIKISFDYLSMVNSILHTHDKKVDELVKKGKQVSEVNAALLEGLRNLVKGYTPVVDAK